MYNSSVGMVMRRSARRIADAGDRARWANWSRMHDRRETVDASRASPAARDRSSSRGSTRRVTPASRIARGLLYQAVEQAAAAVACAVDEHHREVLEVRHRIAAGSSSHVADRRRDARPTSCVGLLAARVRRTSHSSHARAQSFLRPEVVNDECRGSRPRLAAISRTLVRSKPCRRIARWPPRGSSPPQ